MDINEKNELTEKDLAWINSMRDRGFAVVVFTPEELAPKAEGQDLEDFLAEKGNEWLDEMNA